MRKTAPETEFGNLLGLLTESNNEARAEGCQGFTSGSRCSILGGASNVPYSEAMGDGRRARHLRVGFDDVDVARDRRLVLLLDRDQPGKGETTA